jgi:hypothetical protein
VSLPLRIRNNAALLWSAAAALWAAPLTAQQQPQSFVQIADDFSRGSGGWLAGFTDYDLTQGGLRRLAEIRPLPAETGVEGSAYYLQGMNGSDDLFSFLKKPLELEDGIEPDAVYEVEFLIEFASNAPTGCPGAGGSPGDSVYLKVGASNIEPVPILGQEGLRLNLDKGNQSQDGEDATSAGTVANGLECTPANERYVLIERRQAHAGRVTASEHGRLWLFVGTDSGYEGLNQLYYARIVVSLTRVEGGAQ